MRQQRIPSSRLVTDTHKDRRPCCGPPVFFHAFGGQDCHHADNGPAWDRGEEGIPTCRAFVTADWEKSLGTGSTGGCHYPLRCLNKMRWGGAHKISFGQCCGPSLVFQNAASTSRASCPRARTRNSGGLRRPGPSRVPSRPARKQSPRRRAAARPVKARAWAGWRTAGAS